MNKYFFLIIIFASFTNFLYCQEELKGQWVRVDDNIENPDAWKGENYDGLIIEIKETDNGIEGIMLQVPKNAVDHGYFAGQVKWKNFVKISANKYSIGGLLMIRGASDKFDVPTYIKAHIKIIDKDTIKIWTEDQGDSFGGKKQKWKRLPDI